LSRVCAAGKIERFSNRLSLMSAWRSWQRPSTTSTKSNTMRFSTPSTRSRLRSPMSASTRTTRLPRLRERGADVGGRRRLADAAFART
jgi:hypothetical protein